MKTLLLMFGLMIGGAIAQPAPESLSATTKQLIKTLNKIDVDERANVVTYAQVKAMFQEGLLARLIATINALEAAGVPVGPSLKEIKEGRLISPDLRHYRELMRELSDAERLI